MMGMKAAPSYGDGLSWGCLAHLSAMGQVIYYHFQNVLGKYKNIGGYFDLETAGTSSLESPLGVKVLWLCEFLKLNPSGTVK
jgi:hypothetical protein